MSRFDDLVEFMDDVEIDSTFELRRALQAKSFRVEIRNVRGAGPKAVDYMACLVGEDCIAVGLR